MGGALITACLIPQIDAVFIMASVILYGCCNLSTSRLVLSVFLRISSCRAKVCVVLEFPKWGQITASKRSSPQCGWQRQLCTTLWHRSNHHHRFRFSF